MVIHVDPDQVSDDGCLKGLTKIKLLYLVSNYQFLQK